MLTNLHRQRGQALLMLLMIVGVLGAYLAVRAFGQTGQEVKQQQATLAALSEARDALLGFAAVNGRLPCPATALSNGLESPAGGACNAPYTGFLPAATLGLTGQVVKGYLLDPWANRIRYAVTRVDGNAATTANGIKGITGATFNTDADLRVCTTSTGITATTCGAAPFYTTNAAAVIFSIGPNGASSVAGKPDEAANQNNDQVFVYHSKTIANTIAIPPVVEFDDLFVWLPPSTLTNRMFQANQLP